MTGRSFDEVGEEFEGLLVTVIHGALALKLYLVKQGVSLKKLNLAFLHSNVAD